MVPVGEAFLGRAVDGEGQPIDGGPPLATHAEWPAGGVRAGALDRSPVRLSFDTGVRALNALTTFGVGQRIGIMAGSGVGKSVLLDMIAHGAQAEIVIVGLIGERAREVSDFVERHMAGTKRAHSAVIAVPADHAPNLRIRGAMMATALAEYFRAQGRRVLLIMDSLTRVAHAGREIALLLGEPGARALSALGAGHDHQAGGARGQFGRQWRLDHRALHRACRWRQPGRSGGRYGALDP
jgi:flagellum-specific ATP synthase